MSYPSKVIDNNKSCKKEKKKQTEKNPSNLRDALLLEFVNIVNFGKVVWCVQHANLEQQSCQTKG